MTRVHKPVHFAFEYGDESLPHLRDLVSPHPDPQKAVILDYLHETCALASPGIIYDILDPTCVIGDGSLYTDGVYFWPDYLATYVKKYNIPLPTDFRAHILENHHRRKILHLRLRLIKRIVIRNEPKPGFHYEIMIDKDGIVEYRNSIDCPSRAVSIINPDDAAWMIDPIMYSLFCYDDNDHGLPMIDGYHWQIDFYNRKRLDKTVEGWPREGPHRYYYIKERLEFIERFIPWDLGTQYMTDNRPSCPG